MQYTAFIWNTHTVSWSGIVIALAALAAILLALALRAAQGRPLWPMTLLALLSLVLGVYLSRFVHWYCNAAQYASLRAAMTDFSSGGLSVTGVFFAVLLSAGLLRALRVYDDLPAVLDCAAPAGALGLAVGRMACLLSTANRSKFTLTDEALHRLPFSVASTTASGAQEWRIATFCLESISCAVLCAVLLLMFFTLRRAPRFREKWRDGNVFLLFLALYGAMTVVLDSTRYDAGYLRSNGFVSLTQICCVVGLLLAFGLYTARSVIARGVRLWHYPLWALAALSAGLGGYMEYFVQRHGDQFLFAYAVMGSCFMALFLVTLALSFTTGPLPEGAPPREPRKRKAEPAAAEEPAPASVTEKPAPAPDEEPAPVAVEKPAPVAAEPPIPAPAPAERETPPLEPPVPAAAAKPAPAAEDWDSFLPKQKPPRPADDFRFDGEGAATGKARRPSGESFDFGTLPAPTRRKAKKDKKENET